MRIQSTEAPHSFQASGLARLAGICAPPAAVALAALLIPDYVWGIAAAWDAVEGPIAVAFLVGLASLALIAVLRLLLRRWQAGVAGLARHPDFVRLVMTQRDLTPSEARALNENFFDLYEPIERR